MKRTTPIRNDSQLQVQMLRSSVTRMLTNSVLSSRASAATKLGKSFGGKRDLYTALGYPEIISYDDYLGKYERQDIAGRIIDAFVDGAWEQKPVVREVEEEKTGDESKFEKKWIALVKEQKLWAIFTRFDKLTRIGRFGILLLGFNDVQKVEDLKEEVGGAGQKATELLYVQPFGEGSIEIADWDKNPASPRYNLPLTYELTLEDPSSNLTTTSKRVLTRTIKVHYSRVIHNTEGLLASNIYGMPVLQRGYNRLLNLELIVGGSAEMFWQGAFPGYAFVADDDSTISPETKIELKDEIDMFVHDFKRYMTLQGLKVEKLSSEVANPEKHVEVQLAMISIAHGIPLRILTGSERGQLASTQDETHWNDKLHSRRIDHLEPDMVRPTIDRLIQYDVLPDPGEEGYEVFWPDLNAPTDKDKAENGKTRSESIKNYTMGFDTEFLIPFDVFLEEILDLDAEKVARIVDAREKMNGEMLRREAEDGEGLEGGGEE